MTNGPESATSNPTPEKSIRLIRPSVVVLCGPAACGKTTFAVRHFRPTQIISSDHARALVCDDERDQRFSAEAFALVNFVIDQRLGINRLCVVDSTALTLESRKSLLELARKHGVPCTLFLFDVPLETCLARDQTRERSVGQPVIERQYRLFAQESDNIEREGFDQVIKLREEDLDKLRIDVLFRPLPKPSGPAERPEPRRAGYGRPTARHQRSYGAQGGSAPPLPPQRAVRPSSPASQPSTSSDRLHPIAPPPQEPRPRQPSSQEPLEAPHQSSGAPSPSKQS